MFEPAPVDCPFGLAVFLDDYPTVTRDQAVKLLERATMALVGDGNESVA